MSSAARPVADSIVAFIAESAERKYAAEVSDAARLCLADWTGVALGGAAEPAGILSAKAFQNTAGQAFVLTGGTADPRTAALINGTCAHALDFDDTHVASLSHISGPTWAAIFALVSSAAAENRDVLTAFVTGFEVGARLGSAFGPALLKRGLHATSIVGALAATAAGCALLRLDAQATRNALGLAATQGGGLTASFGTMAKPFHAGKAAMNAVIAVDLARAGFTASGQTFDGPGNLAAALIQDSSVSFAPIARGEWQILRNTFKPYASCLLTHPSIDCARQVHPLLDGDDRVARAVAHVHPLAIELAGKTDPQTALEGKFSLGYCVALGLTGRTASVADFSKQVMADAGVRTIAARVELAGDPSLRETAARLEVETGAGMTHRAKVAFALGNPENPMRWPDMEAKFLALAEPRLGPSAAQLFQDLRESAPEAVPDVLAGCCSGKRTRSDAIKAIANRP
jgi:2-methylcitrate dehydratase PrpD